MRRDLDDTGPLQGSFRCLDALAVAALFIAAEFGFEPRLAAQEDPLAQWEVRYPVRQSLELDKVVFGNGHFVATQASDLKSPLVSTDGVSWSKGNIEIRPGTSGLSGITYGNGAFFGVTGEGEVFLAPDATNWLSLSFSPVSDRVEDHHVRIAAGHGILVTMSQEGFVSTSRDGLAWSPPISLEGEARDLIFGNNVFLALVSKSPDAGATVLSSPDGITWTAETESFGGTVMDMTFSDGRFVALTTGLDLVISWDGIAWFNLGPAPMTGEFRSGSFLYADGRFVGLVALPSGEAQVWVSLNGVNWNVTLTTSRPNGMVYGNGSFILFGLDTHTSTTALAWVRRMVAEPAGALPSAVAFGNGRFVAVGGSSVLHSTDGSRWTAVATPANGRVPTGVYFVNGLFLGPSWPVYDRDSGAPIEGYILSSPDGVNWTAHSGPPSLSSLRSIVYGQGRYVAIGQDDCLFSSEDGITWVRQAETEVLTKVVYGDGIFLASAYRAGANSAAPYVSYLYRSSDGISWTKLPLAYNGSLTLRAYGNGVFVAQSIVSFRRHILTSADGDVWATRFSGSNIGFVSTSYSSFAAGRFVLLNPSSVVSSIDSVEWGERSVSSVLSIAEEALHPALAFGNGVFVSIVRGKIQQSGRLTPVATASVIADPDTASDVGPEPGRFTFVRAADSLDGGLAVQFELSGTAVNGEDYEFIEENALIPPGQTSVSLDIMPTPGQLDRTNKTVTATLVADGYALGVPNSATITLNYAGLPPQIASDGIVRSPDGAVQLTIESFPGAEILLETSSDLRVWSGLTNLISPAGLLFFTDLIATDPQRFYRAGPSPYLPPVDSPVDSEDTAVPSATAP